MTNSLDTKQVFSATTLTGSYVVQSSPAYFELTGVEKIVLDVAYTMGTSETSNSIQVRVEYANPLNDNDLPVTTDWHIKSNEATSGSTSTATQCEYTFSAVSAAGTFDRFQITLEPIAKYMRVSIKETGIASNGGTCSIKATLKRDGSFGY